MRGGGGSDERKGRRGERGEGNVGIGEERGDVSEGRIQ